MTRELVNMYEYARQNWGASTRLQRSETIESAPVEHRFAAYRLSRTAWKNLNGEERAQVINAYCPSWPEPWDYWTGPTVQSAGKG